MADSKKIDDWQEVPITDWEDTTVPIEASVIPSEEVLGNVSSQMEEDNKGRELQAKAMAGGLSEGASLGFGGELYGASQAPLGAYKKILNSVYGPLGIGQYEDQDVNKYVQSREAFDNILSQGKEQFPVTTYGAEILGGGVVPASGLAKLGMATKGMGGAITSGSVGGAITGAGAAKEAEEVPMDALQGTIAGGVLGGGVQAGMDVAGGLKKLGQAGIKQLGDTEFATGIASGYKFGKQGIEVTPESRRELSKQIGKQSTDIINQLGGAKKEAQALYDEVFEKATREVPTAEIMLGFLERAKKLPEDLPGQKEAKDNLTKFINNRLLKTVKSELPGGSIAETVEPIMGVSGREAKDIKVALEDLVGELGYGKGRRAYKMAGQMRKDFSTHIKNEIPGLEQTDTKYANVTQLLKDLGVKEYSSPVKKSKVLSKMGRDWAGRGKTAEEVAKKMEEIVTRAEKIDPNIAKQIKDLMPLSEQYDLSRLMGIRGMGTMDLNVTGKTAQGANILGQAQKTASDWAGKNTPEVLKKVASDTVQYGAKGAELGGRLMKASGDTETKRNAALFALEQQPEYRDILKKIVEGSDE